MSGSIDDFFVSLDGSDQRAVFMGLSGTLRFDIGDGAGRVRHWTVRSDKGRLSVGREGGDADCVFVAGAEVFEAVVAGRRNAMAALLRGEVRAAGRSALLVTFQKLFPGPLGGGPDRDVAGYARRRP